MGRLLGINLVYSTAYHPQTDGETERMNQELETYLRIFCGNNPETWNGALPLAEYCHNQRVHSTTKRSPFYLMMGYEPKDIPLAFERTNIPSVETRIKELERAREEALAAHELACQLMAQRSTKGYKPFTKGEKVWLEAKNLKIGYASRKLAPKREGPFEIEEVMGPVTYRLRLLQHWRIHSVFHISLLTSYHENSVHGPNYLRLPPDLINNKEQYEVKAITSHKNVRGKRHYLVKWKHYPTSENTWQTEDDLKNTPEILSSYQKCHYLST
jgi:hypothetical protein